jgi:hypothetical protein
MSEPLLPLATPLLAPRDNSQLVINESEINVEDYVHHVWFHGLTPLRLIGVRTGKQSVIGKIHTLLVVLLICYYVIFWMVYNTLLLGKAFLVEACLPSVLIGLAGVRAITQFRFLVTDYRSRKLEALEFVLRGFETPSFFAFCGSVALMGGVFSVMAYQALSDGYLYRSMITLGASPAGAYALVAVTEVSNLAMFTYTAVAMSLMSSVAIAVWIRQRELRHRVDKLRHARNIDNLISDCRELSVALAVLDRHGSTALKAGVALLLPPLCFFLVDFLVSWVELLRKAADNPSRVYLPIIIDLVVFMALMCPPCFATHASDQLRSAFRRWYCAMAARVMQANDLAMNDDRVILLRFVLKTSQKASCRSRIWQQELSFAKLLSLASFMFFLTVWKFVISATPSNV